MTDAAIDFRSYPAPIKEAWACFEALRRLNFPADVIFFSDRVVGPDGEAQLGVVLKWNGKEAAFHTGPAPADWGPMIKTINHAPELVLQQIWAESEVLKQGLEIILALRKKGIELPP